MDYLKAVADFASSPRTTGSTIVAAGTGGTVAIGGIVLSKLVEHLGTTAGLVILIVTLVILFAFVVVMIGIGYAIIRPPVVRIGAAGAAKASESDDLSVVLVVSGLVIVVVGVVGLTLVAMTTGTGA